MVFRNFEILYLSFFILLHTIHFYRALLEHNINLTSIDPISDSSQNETWFECVGTLIIHQVYLLQLLFIIKRIFIRKDCTKVLHLN